MQEKWMTHAEVSEKGIAYMVYIKLSCANVYLFYMNNSAILSISSWVLMCFLWLSPESLKFTGKYNFEYAHQILDGNNIEPLISENHNCMQIITSFA